MSLKICLCCSFCFKRFLEGEERGKWFDREGGVFYDICLRCEKKIKAL